MEAVESARAHRTYHTADVVIAFARYGVALDTITRALVAPSKQIQDICRRAISRGDLQMMPPESPNDVRSASLTELVNLRAALDNAQATIRQLSTSAREGDSEFMGVAKMTRNEVLLISALARRGKMTKSALYDALYSLRHADEQPEPKIVDVFICKLRKKLGRHGISIRTVWGHGYELTADNVAKLRALAGSSDVPEVESPPLVPAEAAA